MPEHKATPEQWASIRQAAQPREVEPGIFAGDTTTTLAAGLMNLRARVKALEARVSGLQSCHNTTADHLLDIMAMVRGTASAEAQPFPAGSLVERVANRLSAACGLQGGQWDEAAIDVIREVAAWLRRGDAGAGSAWTVAADVLDAVLREEANRG